MRLALALLLLATPALADTSLPPTKYDLGPGMTTVEEIEHVELGYFGWMVPLFEVPVGQARDKCDQLSLARWGTPYPASEIPGGSTLMGCLIRDNDDGNPVIVISYDPQRPELAPRLLRHELGHLMGWPGNHPR
jgi:hypothetical protein